MSRKRLEPRLYLDPTRRHWAIRDGDAFVRTGLIESEIEKAQVALHRYINRQRARWRRTIYFATCDVADFPVKIGISADIEERLRDLNTALPFPVLLLATLQGTSLDEVAIQRRFIDLRIKGEWFRRDMRLMGFIEGIKIAAPGTETVPTMCHTVEETDELCQ